MFYRDWIPWTPGRDDTVQVADCTRERAVLRLFAGGLSEEERCARLLRAMELERVTTETRRAAAAIAVDHLASKQPTSSETIRERILCSRAAITVAALNLMGIQTLLPGEEPFDLLDLMHGSRIYLRKPDDDGSSWRLCDNLDALSGLIRDFRRSTIFINGLRIEPTEPSPDPLSPDPLMLVAAHPAIMAAFGDFLAQKFIIEGWTLT